MTLFRVEMSKVFYVDASNGLDAEQIARDNERGEDGSWDWYQIRPGHNVPDDWRGSFAYTTRGGAWHRVKDMLDEINREAGK